MVTEMIDTEEKERILIVDDSWINREMLTEMLGDSYTYIYAEDGEQLLQLLSHNVKADVLLLDMHMPKMGGMDVLKVMNDRNWMEELPVIIISAETDIGVIRNAYRLGVTDYIQRPYDAFMVQRRVQNVLAMYARNKRLVRLVEQQVLKREKINNMLINILSRVLETGNQESGDHTLRVQQITKTLLERLMKITDRYPLSNEEIALICSASALHDIGKITVPKEILNKPGKLTPEEWEIMKLHTIKGDEMLWELDVNQEEKLMIMAHAICRHHHERYDGGGYPDGLKGDEIPICAQVMSIADVYDALTSDRCYKQAFSHEKAVDMILNGECGCFNPLLLQCLSEVSDDLLINLHLNKVGGGYLNNVQSLTDEALGLEGVAADERTGFLAACERAKKEFFASQCGGIQFEYDAVAHRVLSIVCYDSNGNKMQLSNASACLLKAEDWELLEEKMRRTTREEPIVTMVVQVRVDGAMRWQKLTAQSIWVPESSSYIGIAGQFADIQEELEEKGIDPQECGMRAALETFLANRKTGMRTVQLGSSEAMMRYDRDTLTGVCSRAYLEHCRSVLELADGVAMVDIDQFKAINDRFGHVAGDEVLKHVASMLRAGIRKEDIIIRYGGDEFLLIFQEIEETAFFERLKQIKEEIGKSVVNDEPEIKLSISIGGAYLITPLECAIDTADKAMYRDKYQVKEY